jgi:hypothetical protein
MTGAGGMGEIFDAVGMRRMTERRYARIQPNERDFSTDSTKI